MSTLVFFSYASFFRDGKPCYGSGWVPRKHAAFAPASQKRLGFRLRSPLPSVEEPCPLSLQTVFSTSSLSLFIPRIYGCFLSNFSLLHFSVLNYFYVQLYHSGTDKCCLRLTTLVDLIICPLSTPVDIHFLHW